MAYKFKATDFADIYDETEEKDTTSPEGTSVSTKQGDWKKFSPEDFAGIYDSDTPEESPYFMGQQVSPEELSAREAAASGRLMQTPESTSFGMPTSGGAVGAITDAAIGAANLLESIVPQIKESQRTQMAGRFLNEYQQTGKITVDPGSYGSVKEGIPAVPPTVLEGAEAKEYIRKFATPTEDTALVEKYREDAGMVSRALSGALSQPEQVGSLAGAMLGGAVGFPAVGAAVGMVPLLESQFYSTLLSNMQAGLPYEEAYANAVAKTGVEGLTEMLPGVNKLARTGIGGIMAGGAIEGGVAQLGQIGVDLAMRENTDTPEAYEKLVPKTFGEGVSQIAESALGEAFGAGIAGSAPSVASGLTAAREALSKAGGYSEGKPKADPKATDNTGSSSEETLGDISQKPQEAESIIPPVAEDVKPLLITDAGSIIDSRIEALRAASTEGLLDKGTLESLKKEEEELRLTLQEDEKRRSAGILQTPEKPYLSDQAKSLISERRAELREQLEKHRAAMGYGNSLRDLEQSLNKLGESDQDVINLARKLAPGAETRPVVTKAPQMSATNETTEQAPVTLSEPVTTPPSTTVAAAVEKAPTELSAASQTVSKPATSPPRQMSKAGAGVAASNMVTERLTSDPAFADQVRRQPVLLKVEKDRVAAELQKPEPERNLHEYTPKVDNTVSLDTAPPTETPAKKAFANKQEFMNELYSGVLDKESTEARKVSDNIVVYDGAEDLAAIDPDVAAKVEAAAAQQSVAGAKPRAFQYKGKVYFDLQGVRPGQAKSVFLHEARVHLAAKSDPVRLSSLASRVVALAKAGDATAKEAAATVSREYPGVVKAAREGNKSSVDLSREELLADFVQRVYDREKSGKGVSGTLKRLASDVMSYLRDMYTTVAKRYFGDKFALSITDVDILDAVRYGRTAAGFKGEGAASQLSKTKQASIDSNPAMSVSQAPQQQQQQTGKPAKSPDLKVAIKATKDAVKKQVLPQGTASKETYGYLVEQNRNIAQAYTHEAEVAVRSVYKSLKEAMKGNRAATKDMYNKEMVSYLQGNQNANLPPKLKQSIDAIRNILDRNTIELIALGAVSPKDRQKLINNLGKWTHRDFRVFHLEPGKGLTPGAWKKVVKSLAKRGKKDLEAEAVPFIMQEISLPPANILDNLAGQANRKNKDKQSRKDARHILDLYAKQWNILESKYDKIAERLKGIEALGIDRLREQAVKLADQLLDPQVTQTFDPVRWNSDVSALGIDDSALDKTRKKVPDWLKKLWGEFEDFDAIALLSMQQQGRIIAKFKSLSDFKAIALQKGIIQEDSSITDKSSKPGWVALYSKNPLDFGPLNKHWIKEQDADILFAAKDMSGAEIMMKQSMISWIKVPAFQQLGSEWKKLAVLLSHTTGFVNIATSTTILAGPAAIPHALKGLRIARGSALAGVSVIGKDAALGSQVATDIDYLVRQGVLQNAALSADMRREMVAAIMDEYDRLLPKYQRAGKAVKQAYDWAVDRGGRLNSFGDEIGKVMMFHARLGMLKSVYPSKSLEDLKALAAEEVKDTMPTYERTAPIARKVGNTGIVMPFASWLSEMVRNNVNSLAIAKKYAAMPGAAAKRYSAYELTHIGIKAGAVYAASKGLGYATYLLAMGMTNLLGGDDDELKQAEEGQKISIPENLMALREIAPDYVVGDVVVSRKIDDDTLTYYSTHRYDPLPVGSMYLAIQDGSPDRIERSVMEWLGGVAPMVEPIGNAVAGAAGGDSDQFYRALGDMKYLMTPGFAKTLVRPFTAAGKGTPFTATEQLITQMGATVQVLDMKQRIGQIAADYNFAINSEKKSQTIDLKDEGLLEKYGIVSDINYEGWVATKLKAWDKAHRKVEAFKELGKSDDWIYENIKLNPASSSLSDVEIVSLLNGEFVIPDFETWMEDKREQELNDPKNSKRIADIEQKYERYRKDYEGVEDQIRKTLEQNGVKIY